ncbi:MAG: type III toxin-antitoxin system ToxN/AbiQ family toxin [Oscillospiraceae bacterium]|nr:type III toxin-antitoxin system ToxN/AbiQ family toxin [Oscillospiraceae bacterium]
MDFYRIDENYIAYLQQYEKEKRGFTRVPNVKYADRNKFAFGAVLEVGNIKYYVSVSSYTKPQEANILIKVPGDSQEVKGSLRFNYMVPVPEECLTRLVIKDIEDERYRRLLNKEYRFCQNNVERIQKKAEKIYSMIVTNRKQVLTDNSCDFKLLEQAYKEYIDKERTKS